MVNAFFSELKEELEDRLKSLLHKLPKEDFKRQVEIIVKDVLNELFDKYNLNMTCDSAEFVDAAKDIANRMFENYQN